MTADSHHFSDVVCSFCGRHNREVRVVTNEAGLIICQVCVAKAAKIFDEEVGLADGQDWLSRWPLKRARPAARTTSTPPRSGVLPFQVVIHSDWGTSPSKRWSAEARLVDGQWVAFAPRPVPDPLALIAGAESTILGFDFPIGLPARYARDAGIDDFVAALPHFGSGQWVSFYEPAKAPTEVSLPRPFYPHGTVGVKHQHLLDGLGASRMNELRRRCDHGHDGRGPAEVMFWTLGPKQVGRAAIAGWRDLLAPARNRIRIWPFQGTLAELSQESVPVVCETYPAEFYGHFGLPRAKTEAARASAAGPLLDAAARLHVRLDSEAARTLRRGFENDDAYDAFVGLLGMLSVVLGLRAEAPTLDDETRRVEGWMLGCG